MNNRIDLNQFKGHIEKLGLREGHFLHIVEEPNRAVGPWNKWEGGLVFDLGETSPYGTHAIATARLMVAAPRFLAELKRCYEELDEAEYRLEMAEDVLGRSDWISVYRELIGPPE